MRSRFTIVALAASFAATQWVAATDLTDLVSLQGTGYTIVEDGVGLETLGAGSADLTVDIGGSVVAAYLWWAGRELDCLENGAGTACEIVEPFGDQEMVFDGNTITGTITGTEENFGFSAGRKLSIGYRMDVTAIVSAAGLGSQTFSISDGDLANNLQRLNGAGLLVIYEDAASTTDYLVIVKDGMDFAHVNSTPDPEAKTTTPATYNYPVAGGGRGGELVIFSGDNEDRPDRILISDNADIDDMLNGVDGPEWDSLVINFNIPAGSTSTTVELVSPPEFVNVPSDSLMWALGAMRIPLVDCVDDSDCDDGDVCTDDVCDLASGTCLNFPTGSCCVDDADCDDGNVCTEDVCDPTTGDCSNDGTPDCCVTDSDCDDGDECTDDVCENSQCINTDNDQCELECRVTGGGHDDFDGHRYTFGGQGGAPGPLFGEWTHHEQRGPDNQRFIFHTGTHSAPEGTYLHVVGCSDPDFCDPARHAPAKQIDLEGVGSFRNIRNATANLDNVVAQETLHWMTLHIEDLGEPGNSARNSNSNRNRRARGNEEGRRALGGQDDVGPECPDEGSPGESAACSCPDFYRITIYEAFQPGDAPNMTDVIYDVYGYIDGGNLQIHPALGG
jgi:hypothetical protein